MASDDGCSGDGKEEDKASTRSAEHAPKLPALSLKRITQPSQDGLGADQGHAAPRTIQVSVVLIKQNKASQILGQINSQWPLAERLGHLKRIRKSKKTDAGLLEVLLDEHQPYADWEGQLDAANIPHEGVEIQHVPADAPPRKELFAIWNRIWPVVFHDTMKQKLEISEDMQISKLLQEHVHLFFPRDQTIIDGACWVFDGHAGELVVCQKYDRFTRQCGDTRFDQECCSPFSHAAMNSIAKISQANLSSKSTVHAAAIATSIDAAIVRSSAQQYLLTNYIVVCQREPCLMCAMAMVHSRVRAIVFIHPDPLLGALASRTRLHTVQALNHHYSVFQLTNTTQ